ncbi:MAG TPA: hypothetical protein PLY09_00985 [Methanothrix sp.]|nr:hypothetical protein [Methanothrix sp.]HPJ83318.1 hypothetical protein [Methanothrix sp.]
MRYAEGIYHDQPLQEGQGNNGEGEKEEEEAGRETEKSAGSRREAHKIDGANVVIRESSSWRDVEKPTSI